MPASPERHRSRPFDTEAEAWAYREGVEMVNDSAITELEVIGSGPYVVTWLDREASQNPTVDGPDEVMTARPDPFDNWPDGEPSHAVPDELHRAALDHRGQP